MALPVPREDLRFFPVDPDGMWGYSGTLTAADAAHAAAALLRYIYADPAEMAPFEMESDLPDDVGEELLASLTGSSAAATEQGRGAPPAPRLIRTPHDAELVVADWMRWLGYTNVGVTPIGADAGIDVFSNEAIAQVKREGVPTGRPIIQNAYGVAVAEGKTALVFSLGGYVSTAVEWANSVGVPLFTFDLQGVPDPVNPAARQLLAQ